MNFTSTNSMLSKLTNEYPVIQWILHCIPNSPLYSIFICKVNTEYLWVVSSHNEYEYRWTYAYSLFNHSQDLIMIFMFSIQSHYGHPKLFIFSIQFTFVKLYSVFNSVFTKPRYKVFSMLFSMLFNFPQSIQYAMRYSGIVLYWHLSFKQAEQLRSIRIEA